MPVLSADPIDDGYDPFPPEASKVRPIRPTAPQQEKPPVEPLDWVALASKSPPERRWAIKGWFGFGHVTLLVGQGGIGKTLIAQQMASCLALGRNFVAEVESKFRVLMWACEDDHDELWRRQLALARWAKVGLEEFAENLVIVPRHGLENSIVTTEYGRLMYTPRLAELEEHVHDLSADIVILDNVAQLYGAGENDRYAVTAFLNALSGALQGRALMLLAHPSRSYGSEFSGSSAWENVARTRLYLGATLPGEKHDPEADPQDNVRYLARRKANYSPKDWRRMTYADGALTPDEIDPSAGVVASIRAAKAEAVIVNGLNKLTQMGVRTAEGTRSPQYLPKLLLDYTLNEGYSRPDLSAAMRRLLVAGRLRREVVGKSNANRMPQYGLAIVT